MHDRKHEGDGRIECDRLMPEIAFRDQTLMLSFAVWRMFFPDKFRDTGSEAGFKAGPSLHLMCGIDFGK